MYNNINMINGLLTGRSTFSVQTHSQASVNRWVTQSKITGLWHQIDSLSPSIKSFTLFWTTCCWRWKEKNDKNANYRKRIRR